ncbi:MAG: transporter substrate-binding domain-containing protein [Alphaproteobacteria bacterium]|nr:transporter substrate-binding domain-containing protein [Alphaproteobacteria bacterium]
MRLRTLLAFLAAVAAVVAPAGDPARAGAFEEAQARGRLLIGVRADYPPFAFIDGEGRNAGLEIDIARYLALRLMGSENRLRLVPLAGYRRVDGLLERRVDLAIASLAVTEDRRSQVLFTEPYYGSGVGLLLRKDAPIKTWADMRRRRVCAIEAAGYEEQLATLGVELARFPALPGALRALRDGGCEGLAYDDSALAARLIDPEWGNEFHLPLPSIGVVPWAIGLRREDDALRNLVNPVLLEMEASGFIVGLEAKWRLRPSQFARERMVQARRQLGLR